VRIHPHRAHIIIYQDMGADILIIRIRHGREDWARSD
jgi:toxin ParE1/3/4